MRGPPCDPASKANHDSASAFSESPKHPAELHCPTCVHHLHPHQLKHWLSSLHLVAVCEVAGATNLERVVCPRSVDLTVVLAAADKTPTYRLQECNQGAQTGSRAAQTRMVHCGKALHNGQFCNMWCKAAAPQPMNEALTFRTKGSADGQGAVELTVAA
jgi:hypothetical protein